MRLSQLITRKTGKKSGKRRTVTVKGVTLVGIPNKIAKAMRGR